MDLLVTDETNQLTESQKELIVSVIEFAAQDVNINLPEDTEMSVTVVDDNEIRVINREHRDKDRATDVISFALEEDSVDGFDFDLEELGMPRNIGDIFISIDKVTSQAQEYNHSFDRELAFLTLHGFLHLNGYDHMTETDEIEMFDLQRKILSDYGLKR